MLTLKNKNVLITGSSSGIGAAIAEAFANAGACVGIHYSSNKEDALNLLNKLEKITTIKAYKQDFLDDNNDNNLIKRFVEDFGTIHILINNAGVTSSTSILDLSPQEYKDLFKINSQSALMLSKDAFIHMKQQKFGRIINISGQAVKFGRGRNNSIHYAASKATLNVLTTGLAHMGAEHNILVNSISPGLIKTRIQANREDLDKRINLIPLKRIGTTEDIANLAVYLASDMGSFITGQIIGVSGGE